MNRNKIESGPKSPEVAEIKAFFKEAEKVPLADVLVSTFKNHTIASTWELRGDKIIGRIQEGVTPVAALTIDPHEKENVTLEIFDREDELHGRVRFFAGRIDYLDRQWVSPFYDVRYSFSEKGRSLLYDCVEYERVLIKIADEVALKVAQIPEEKRKLYGKGIIPNRGSMRDGWGSGGG